MPWNRKWQRTPVFLPGNPMDRGAFGLQSTGSRKSQTRLKWLSTQTLMKTEVDLLHFTAMFTSKNFSASFPSLGFSDPAGSRQCNIANGEGELNYQGKEKRETDHILLDLWQAGRPESEGWCHHLNLEYLDSCTILDAKIIELNCFVSRSKCITFLKSNEFMEVVLNFIEIAWKIYLHVINFKRQREMKRKFHCQLFHDHACSSKLLHTS